MRNMRLVLAHTREFLGHNCLGDEGCAAAAVLGGVGEGGELHLLQGLEGVPREFAGAVGFGGKWRDLVFGEAAHDLTKGDLFAVE